MPNLDRIPEAIADLDTQEVPNITETVRKHTVESTVKPWEIDSEVEPPQFLVR